MLGCFELYLCLEKGLLKLRSCPCSELDYKIKILKNAALFFQRNVLMFGVEVNEAFLQLSSIALNVCS